jgi:hypothetical protein
VQRGIDCCLAAGKLAGARRVVHDRGRRAQPVDIEDPDEEFSATDLNPAKREIVCRPMAGASGDYSMPRARVCRPNIGDTRRSERDPGRRVRIHAGRGRVAYGLDAATTE